MIHVKYYATRGAALLVSLLSIHSLTHSLAVRAYLELRVGLE